MHHASDSQPLKVLVVTEDRALQRQLSQFFDMMGYPALHAADPQSALAAVTAQCPHILLIGTDLAARAGWELCGLLSQRLPSAGLFTFLMIEEPDEILLQEALEAGIDDFLLKPIGYGELLSRLRSAARVLEYDRRVCQQGRLDAPTGLLSRSAFASQLRRQMAPREGTPPRAACVVLDLDFFSRIDRLHGASAGAALLQAVAKELNELRSGSEVLGCLGGDLFCALLPDANLTAAVEWAERARQVLSATKFKLAETTVQITASFGVAACDQAESAEQLVEQATQALQTAKSSGRNCVVRSGEFGADASALTAPGTLFERTVARDVMTACTVFLQPDELVGQAIDQLHRTRLEGIPVVDSDGKLVGLCEQEIMITVAESDYATRLVGDLMTTDVQSFGEQESLASLVDFLARDARSLIIIVDEEARPVGFVTSNSLLAMSRRVTTDSFAAEAAYSDTSQYLVVPDLCPQECSHTV
jgi:two-component system cell cycle response regulator